MSAVPPAAGDLVVLQIRSKPAGWMRVAAVALALAMTWQSSPGQATSPLGARSHTMPVESVRPPSGLTGAAREARMELLRQRLAEGTAGARFGQREERGAFVELVREWQELRRLVALERAAALGLTVRGEVAGGRVFELIGFDGDRPRYLVTNNMDAAIATHAAAVRSTAPFFVDGAGLTLGIWDGGLVLATHQEFGTRIIPREASGSAMNHATHVAGTMIAAGVDPQAMGMAPAASLFSYNWTNDWAEMASVGASFPGEPGTIPISNHSYSYSGGWAYYGAANYDWVWFGLYSAAAPQSANIEDNFGQYTAESATLDAVVAGAPYYLPFLAAGNERNDTPASGDTWRLAAIPGSKTYNPATDPLADGAYKSGYDNLMFTAGAKNVLTVGAVTDADDQPGAFGGNRSIAAAAISSFSSWGPTDDGRIKPDIVANGVGLKSSIATSNTTYTTYSGTSMASPNASGSAALLVGLFGDRFPASAMRASTLKALIIHTADDLGTAGPDYRHGWGLMNTLAAAQLIDAHSLASGAGRLIEGRLTSTKSDDSFVFAWDGVSPIRATLAWTDPAGTARSGHDNRAPSLVNDLDLLITGPTGVLHRPFVMPHVGDWTTATLGTAATTGTNTVDNVEQVLIAAPALSGNYTVSVGSAGALTGGSQAYSLIVSGAGRPTPAPPPVIDSFVAPAGCVAGDLVAVLDGAGFQLGANLRLTRAGHADVDAFGPEVFTDRAQGRFRLGTVAPGFWSLKLVNPDGQEAIVPLAVEAPVTLIEEDFEGAVAGWITTASENGVLWGLTDDLSSSPVMSAYGPGTAGASESALIAPEVEIPMDWSCARLTFRQWFSLQSGGDGGALEVSFNGGGTWADITTAGGTFLQNGYNATLTTGTNPIGASGRAVWTGSSGTFVTTEVALDPAMFAGQAVVFRWRLGCNASGASTGWLIDDVTLRVDVSDTWGAFEYWRHEIVGDAFAVEAGDADGDGKDLFGEYAFAGDPAAGDGPVAEVGTVDGYLTITFPVRLDATDVVFTVQTTTAIGAWIDAAVYTSNGVQLTRNGATNTVQASVSSDGTRALVTERNAIPIAAEPQRFLRVIAARAGL